MYGAEPFLQGIFRLRVNKFLLIDFFYPFPREDPFLRREGMNRAALAFFGP